MFKRIADYLVLTKSERNAIIFLVIALCVGAGIKLYQNYSQKKYPQNFDYSASDSTFNQLSKLEDDSLKLNNEDSKIKSNDKLNINVATKKELIDLPEIGEVTAERILQYRKERGKFKSIDELSRIKGLSKKKLLRLEPYIRIN